MFSTPLAPKEPEPARAEKPKRPTIDERFAEFARANPHVFDELKRLAMKRLAEGGTRIGVKALWEELRASLIKIDDGGGPGYKLNNDFTALYSRMLIEKHPELSAVIEIRRRKDERDR